MPEFDDGKHSVTVGFGGIAVVFMLQVIFPATIGVTCLYPVAVLGALWTNERWVVLALGIVGSVAVLAPPMMNAGSAINPPQPQYFVGALVAIWLTVFVLLLERRIVSADHTTLLRSTFENLPSGLVVYDADDRMVLCNVTNKKLYPAVANLMVPGVTFEEMVRATADRNLYDADDLAEEYVQERVQRHKSCGPPHIQALSDGRQLFIQETELPDGAILVLRTDITALD